MGRTGRLIRLALAGLLLAFEAAAETMPVVAVAPGIYVRQGADADATAENLDAIANIGFIVGGTATAVIDPGGSLPDGEQLRAAVLATTDRPIRYVIMTHGHPDHIFGGAAFAADHPIVAAHARLPAALASRGAYYRDRLAAIVGRDRAGDYLEPTLLVASSTDIDLGGRVLRLRAWGPAHSDSDLTIFDPETATLWAGDLLFVGRIPSLDGGLRGWLRALDELTAIPAVRAVPGHGPISVPWPAAASDERRYLETVLDGTRKVLAANGSIETAIATVAQGERGRWTLFDDYNGRNVTEAFNELEWE